MRWITRIKYLSGNKNLQNKISITINEIRHRIFKLEAALELLANQEDILIRKLDISLLQTQIGNVSKKNKDMEVMLSEQQKGNASGIKEQRLNNSRKQNHTPYPQVTKEDEPSKVISRKSQNQVRELNGIQEIVDVIQTIWGTVSAKTVSDFSEKEEKKATEQHSYRVENITDEII